jgi:hypothetical protein
MPLPTLSRILWALSTRRQNGAEPYGLIEQDYSAENRRRKVIRLSARDGGSCPGLRLSWIKQPELYDNRTATSEAARKIVNDAPEAVPDSPLAPAD